MIRHLAAIQHGARGLVLAMALPACVDHQRFHPIEKATGESPEGVLAADYELETEGGIRLGETRVWSNGAEDAEVDGEDATVVNIGFIVENESAKTIILSGSQLSLDVTTTDGRTISDLKPIRGGAGNTEVGPRGQERVQVAFELSPEVEPSDIRSFRVAVAGRQPRRLVSRGDVVSPDAADVHSRWLPELRLLLVLAGAQPGVRPVALMVPATARLRES
jgi:hypothetical protein